MNKPQARLIKRKFEIIPRLYDLDLQCVVYNVNYFKWFDEARLQIILEMISFEEIIQTGISFMIAENHCQYKNYASYGEKLIISTTHRIQPVYQGRLEFFHSVIHEKKKIEIASGSASMIVVNHQTKQLIKEMPEFIWNRYINLK